MKELQMLVNKWKQQAEPIRSKVKNDMSNVYARIDLARLDGCILDAELLLNTQPNSDTTPQLNKHDVSGWVAFGDMKPSDGAEILVSGDAPTDVFYKIYSSSWPQDAWKDYYWRYLPLPPIR